MTSYNGVDAMLLAAGFGSRLRPLTDTWPKCLMPIAGRPLLEYWLELLVSLNIRKVVVNTHSNAQRVIEFISTEKYLGWVNCTYEPVLLGTAGTLRANADLFRGRTVLLIHADNWCHCDFQAFIDYHFNSRPLNCAISMMTFFSERPSSCGVVETNQAGVVTAIHEKVRYPPGNIANGAVYLLEPEVLDWIEHHPHITDFSTEVLPRYIKRIATWFNSNIHRDIGVLSELRAAQKDPATTLPLKAKDDWQKNFESSSIFLTLMQHINEPGTAK